MPLPDDIGRFTLTGEFPPLSPDGTERAGTVTFTPVPAVLVSDTGVYLGTENATLSASGTFSKVLVANDALAEAFVWRVDAKITGLPPFSQNISVPASAGTVALGTVLETETLPGNYYVVVGPQGPQGEPGSGGGGGGTPSGPAGGDLSGTYPNPSVAKLAGVTVSGTPSSGQVPTATSGTAASWATPATVPGAAGTVTGSTSYGQSSTAGAASTFSRGDHVHGSPSLASSAAANSAVGDTAAVGTGTAPARADHVHGREAFGAVTAQTSYGASSGSGSAATPARSDHTHGTPAAPTVGTTIGTYAAGDDSRFTNARTPTGTASGDLSGTYPGPTVAAVNGVTVSGTAASGKVLTATGASAATWQTPSGGGGTSIRTASVRVTDDNLGGLPSAAAWTIVQTSAATKLQCSITASVGDRVKVYGGFMRAGSHFLDWVLLDNTGAIALYAGTFTSSPLPEGDPDLYPSLSFGYEEMAEMFTVASGHISAGSITVALAHQGTGAGVVYAHTTYPFRMRLENIGPEPA